MKKRKEPNGEGREGGERGKGRKRWKKSAETKVIDMRDEKRDCVDVGNEECLIGKKGVT